MEQNFFPEKITFNGLTWDIIIGLMIGVAFIFGNILAPSFVTIGIPQEYFTSAQGGYIASVFVAPFAEEMAFRGVLTTLLSIPFGGVIAGVAQAIIFAIFHITAYSLGLQSALIGAFGFGLVSYIVSKARHSIVPVIVLHMVFNAFILSSHLFFAA